MSISSIQVRASLVRALRRDLIGPEPDGAEDADLHRERLSEKPSSWYLAGFIAPDQDEAAAVDAEGEAAVADDSDLFADEDGDNPLAPGEAGSEDEIGEAPTGHRRFFPASIGLTVLVDPDVTALDVRVTWGDYVTEPPVPPAILKSEGGEEPRRVDWIRKPRQAAVEVAPQVLDYGDKRRRLDPTEPEFANRRIDEPLELTSRVSTDQVAEAKRRLEAAFGGGAHSIDVALATNMISVGLDITRLGLMVVQGQPKGAAEYIQATSRVGRVPTKPGLIAVILNLHKPRDRAHFEQFTAYHTSFYRAVEATSVTPWAARALDRSLAAVVVAILRHMDDEMTPEGAVRTLADRPDLQVSVREVLLARAPAAAIAGGKEALGAQIDAILKAWLDTVEKQTVGGQGFVYSKAPAEGRLLQEVLGKGVDDLDADHRKFRAGRSMRDVEPPVPLKIKDPYGNSIGGDPA